MGGLLFVLVCTGSPQVPPQNLAGGLGGTSWHLVKFHGGDDRTLTPDYQGKYTIAFESDGRVSVRIDCNRGHGTWKSSGPNQLKFGPLALTRKMCRPAALNERVTKDWMRIRSYVLKDNHLFLSVTAADGGIYEFEPAAQGAQAGGGVNCVGRNSARQEPAISGLSAKFVGNKPCADCSVIQ